MDNLSIIMPCELNRLPLFLNTLNQYKQRGFPNNLKVEFLLITRSAPIEMLVQVPYDTTDTFVLRIIDYQYDGDYINPALALNMGVKYALFDNIMVTCPEIMPESDVLFQLSKLDRGNYVCKVIDQNEDGNLGMTLVDSKFRNEHPGMYFMNIFKKEDIESINGWDNEFMKGIAYEDDDFGHRWLRAKLPFTFKDDIVAIHQYHKRNELSDKWTINQKQMIINDNNNVIRPKDGLRYLNE